MRQTKSLKIIDQITIKEPCHESWDKMKGNQSARHCDSCVHTVINLSALTKKQAETILKNRGNKRLCVRYEISISGLIKFKKSFWEELRQICSVFLAIVCTFLGLSTMAIAEDQVKAPEITQVPSESVKMGEMPMNSPSPSPIPNKELMGDVAIRPVQADVKISHDAVIKMGKVAASD